MKCGTGRMKERRRKRELKLARKAERREDKIDFENSLRSKLPFIRHRTTCYQFPPTRTANPQINAGLLHLPLEVRMMILVYLDDDDLACIAMTCHLLVRELGIPFSPWRQRLTRTERWDDRKNEAKFLARYARDLPDRFYCLKCRRLQNYRSLQGPNLSLEPRGKDCSSHDDFTALRVYWWFIRFIQIQAVLADHRNPGCGLPLESLFITMVGRDRGLRSCHNTRLLACVDAKVISDELYLRSQRWVVYECLADLLRCNHRMAHLSPCRHYGGWGVEPANLARELQGGLRPAVFDSEKAVVKSLVCGVCSAHSKFQLKQLNDGQIALVMTTWLGLGRAMVFTDPMWRRHTAEKIYPVSGGWPRSQEHEDIYEGAEGGLGIAELTDENQRCLASKSYESRPFVRGKGRGCPENAFWLKGTDARPSSRRFFNWL